MTTSTTARAASPISVVNPATGALVHKFAPHTPEQIEQHLQTAHDAAATLRTTDFALRATWLRRAADLLEADIEAVARTIVVEMGKTIGQARAEVSKSVSTMRFYADGAEQFLADSPLPDPEAIGGARQARTSYQPLGVVLAVMPWNYPIWQVMRFAAPALMAGNAGVLKHASNVPQSAHYLGELFTRGGFPQGAFTSLRVGSAVVESLVADPRIKAVALTGSEGAGRSVGASAGRAIKKAVLELGGSDPFIVLPSADIERASTVAVAARMNNNGQSCIAGKRFIVHTDVYDEFARLFAEKVAALTVGDPLDEKTEIGPLATASGRDEIAELVDDALEHGATVLATADVPEGSTGWYYPPTVLENVGPDSRLFQEEAFGPVAVLYRAANDEEAIALANGTPFGLSSAVWTTDAEQERYFVEALDAGAVFVNGMSVSYPQLSFGGVKASGFGRELGTAGIREFCNLKSVWVG